MFAALRFLFCSPVPAETTAHHFHASVIDLFQHHQTGSGLSVSWQPLHINKAPSFAAKRLLAHPRYAPRLWESTSQGFITLPNERAPDIKIKFLLANVLTRSFVGVRLEAVDNERDVFTFDFTGKSEADHFIRSPSFVAPFIKRVRAIVPILFSYKQRQPAEPENPIPLRSIYLEKKALFG